MWADDDPEEGEPELPGRWWARRVLRAEPWPLLLVAVALLLAYCWWYASPAVAMVALNYYGDFCYGFVLFGIIAAAWGVQLFIARGRAKRYGLLFDDVRSRRRFWPWLGAIVAATIALVHEEVPLHAGFHVSRPWLDTLADEALTDPPNAHRLVGRWAGGYRVAGVEVIGETVVIYVDRPEGNYGFARVPGARTDHIVHMPDRPNDPTHHAAFPPYGRNDADPVGQRLAGDWFVVYSAYWRVKVGPS